MFQKQNDPNFHYNSLQFSLCVIAQKMGYEFSIKYSQYYMHFQISYDFNKYMHNILVKHLHIKCGPNKRF